MWRDSLGRDLFVYGLGILSGILLAFPLTELGLSFDTKFGFFYSLTYVVPVWGIVFLIVHMRRRRSG